MYKNIDGKRVEMTGEEKSQHAAELAQFAKERECLETNRPILEELERLDVFIDRPKEREIENMDEATKKSMGVEESLTPLEKATLAKKAELRAKLVK